MYSTSLEKLLKKDSIQIGDRIIVDSDKGKFEGLLMPRTYESDIIVLKLDNGYNIGLSSKNVKIKLLAKAMKKIQTTNSEKPEIGGGEIAILGCGGTIASKVEYKTGAVYPAISPQELKLAFPALNKIAPIHAKQIFSLFSEDMTVKHWQIIADTIVKEIKEGVRGVVLMHGTDVMHYTAAAISFMLQNLPVPIVFVGAQRSSDRPSSDNELNLLNAVFAARQDFAEVGVCMHASTNDDSCYLHRGVRVRKMHTSRRDAFKSINSLPIARVDYRNNIFEILTGTKKRASAANLKVDTRMSDNTAIVYFYPGMKPTFLKKLHDYDGIVLVGTGMGHVATNPFNDKNAESLLPAIKDLIASGIPVVMAPQTIYGRLDMKVYTAGRLLTDAGVIGDGCDWLPEVAYAKLSWILGHTKNMKKVREELLTNMVGELSERSLMV